MNVQLEVPQHLPLTKYQVADAAILSVQFSQEVSKNARGCWQGKVSQGLPHYLDTTKL